MSGEGGGMGPEHRGATGLAVWGSFLVVKVVPFFRESEVFVERLTTFEQSIEAHQNG
ncbi:hypothetical protein ROS217_22492 [Roseovarius sp. 217]|nr:hypothetical protein ROS217_22492 [Roseovarius sp. 217]